MNKSVWLSAELGTERKQAVCRGMQHAMQQRSNHGKLKHINAKFRDEFQGFVSGMLFKRVVLVHFRNFDSAVHV